MIFKLRGGAGGKRNGESLQKGKKVGRGDKSQSPSSEGGFKDYQASHLRIPLGWGCPTPSEPGLERGTRGWAEVGPWEGRLLRHFFWGQKSFWERAPDINGRPWGCQATQDGWTHWFRALSRASHSCNSEKKWIVVLFRADGDCRWFFFF